MRNGATRRWSRWKSSLTDDEVTIRKLLEEHTAHRPAARVAAAILENFSREKRKFVKVMPIEYKRVLLETAMDEEELGLMGVSDG